MAQASQFPFQPLGQTVLIASNNPAPTPVQVPTFASTQSYGQYRIVNNSNQTVFLGVGGTAAQATARAAAIVAGTPAYTLVLVPGAVEIVRFANESFFTAFSTQAASVYITPGQGL
jgi:hypothetical protein